ncbi:MAG: type transport system permease protein [Thermoplasmata archaeon]|nr:type transport system permease protein [Thermoplasmata archaeon]
MTHARWVIAGKELKGVFTERTILLAVVIQVIVAGFSGFLVVGLSALIDPGSLPSHEHPTLAVGPGVMGDASLMSHLADQGIQTMPERTDADALAKFRNGTADGALALVPERVNGTTGAIEPARLSVTLPEGDIKTTLTLVEVKTALEGYERDLRAQHQDHLAFNPVYVDVAAKAGSYSFVYTLLIPLLVFLPVVLAGALCADSLTEEVQRKTLPLLLASPATPADVVEGKLMANVVVAPGLAAAWFVLLGLNHLTVPFWGAVGILLLATSVAYLLGLLACGIALATRDRNKAHVTYASAMFLLLGLSLALPMSPVNVTALLASGSATPQAWGIVAAFCATALAGTLALRVGLRRSAQWMAAGTA